ncbi:MAG: 4Fe-4S dicluster domain-containing protein [Dorea sp.]
MQLVWKKMSLDISKPTIDIEKCVNCGICTKVCPVVNEGGEIK